MGVVGRALATAALHGRQEERRSVERRGRTLEMTAVLEEGQP